MEYAAIGIITLILILSSAIFYLLLPSYDYTPVDFQPVNRETHDFNMDFIE